jgi:hypothetical protein
MVSELTQHNGWNLLFLPTICILWFCPHSLHTRHWLPWSQKETLIKCMGISRKELSLIMAIYSFHASSEKNWSSGSINPLATNSWNNLWYQLLTSQSRGKSLYGSHFIWEQFYKFWWYSRGFWQPTVNNNQYNDFWGVFPFECQQHPIYIQPKYDTVIFFFSPAMKSFNFFQYSLYHITTQQTLCRIYINKTFGYIVL